MYNASEKKQIRQAEKAAKIAERERHEIIRGLMSLPASRKWVFDELGACHVFNSIFSSDPLKMAFAEGERNRGLRLLNDVVVACPKEYILMLQEAAQRQVEDKEKEDGNGRIGDRADADGGDSGSGIGDEDRAGED